jgi:hypothetical protein
MVFAAGSGFLVLSLEVAPVPRADRIPAVDAPAHQLPVLAVEQATVPHAHDDMAQVLQAVRDFHSDVLIGEDTDRHADL